MHKNTSSTLTQTLPEPLQNKTLSGHMNWVSALAVLPSGLVVSGSDDKTIRVWDVAKGACLKVLKSHTDKVGALTVLPSGELVSGSDDKTIRVWNVAKGECLKILKGHRDGVSALTVLPSGALVSGSRDNSIRVWDVAQGKCLKVLKGHTAWVSALSVLPTGEVVSGSDDGTLRLWDVASGKCLKVLRGHTRGVCSLTVLPNGNLVSGAWDKTLRVWDVVGGGCLKVLTNHMGGGYALTVLPSGLLVNGSLDDIGVWDVEKGECLKVLQGHTQPITAFKVLPSGELVSGSGDNTLRVWTETRDLALILEREQQEQAEKAKQLALARQREAEEKSRRVEEQRRLEEKLKEEQREREKVQHEAERSRIADEQFATNEEILGINYIKAKQCLAELPVKKLLILQEYDLALKVLISEGSESVFLEACRLGDTELITRVLDFFGTELVRMCLKVDSKGYGALNYLFGRGTDYAIKLVLKQLDKAILPMLLRMNSPLNSIESLDVVRIIIVQFHENLNDILNYIDIKLLSQRFGFLEEDLTSYIRMMWISNEKKRIIKILENDAVNEMAKLDKNFLIMPLTDYGTTAIGYAAIKSNLEVIKLLAEKLSQNFFNQLVTKSKSGFIPVFSICSGRNPKLNEEAVRSILQLFPSVDLLKQIKDDQGKTIDWILENRFGKSLNEILFNNKTLSSTLVYPKNPTFENFSEKNKVDHVFAGVVELNLSIQYTELKFDKRLGQGAYGEVYSGIWRYNQVAIKKLLGTNYNEDAIRELQQEAQVLAKVRSDYVVQIKGLAVQAPNYCLVMELMPKGNLYELLQSEQPLGWTQRYQLAQDIGIGLHHLHAENILHRDLKSLNVLLSETGRAKLCDFGLAKIKTTTKTQSRMTQTNATGEKSVGTLPWMAPELFGLRPKYSTKSDIYAYGIIMWELSARRVPYEDVADETILINEVKQGAREEIPDNTPPSYAKLITFCWAQKPEERPEVEKVLEELEGCKNQLRK